MDKKNLKKELKKRFDSRYSCPYEGCEYILDIEDLWSDFIEPEIERSENSSYNILNNSDGIGSLFFIKCPVCSRAADFRKEKLFFK